ncbi:MAG: PRC-barrel domain-containing protein [Proteobacteria bacterium]|nr:PRC-barrel domain-containing protein [Pseudomonadota bacterium]
MGMREGLMIVSKLRSAPGMAFAFVIGFALALQTLPVMSQDQQQPPAEAEPAAPAEGGGDATAPAAEPSQEGATAPSAEPSAEPAQDSGASSGEAPAGDAATAPPAGTGSGEAPAQPEAPATESAQPAAPEGSAPAAAVTASQVQIGAAVFGSDGAKIGEVNGVKSDDTGKVQQILVTDGMPAGINAKVFEISADKITSVGDGVKLSLSSEEAKKLPIVDNGNG